jgi:hypothetical protein
MNLTSDVVITMFEKDYLRMEDLAAKYGDNHIKSLVSIPDQYDVFKDEKGRELVTLAYYNIKWDYEYDEVRFVDNFLRSGIAYHFLQLVRDSGGTTVEHSHLVNEADGFDEFYCATVEPVLLKYKDR